jgi:probable rRNA maturation factor
VKARVDLPAAHPRSRAYGRVLKRSAGRFLATLGLSSVELSISLVTDRAIRRLNRAWRKKDESTDVLSFPAGDLPRGTTGPRPLGDVVISLDTAVRQAGERGLPLTAELDRYLAHGLLHLLGHDHHRKADARRMARMERKLLGRDGLLSPPT